MGLEREVLQKYLIRDFGGFFPAYVYPTVGTLSTAPQPLELFPSSSWKSITCFPNPTPLSQSAERRWAAPGLP